LFLLILLWSVAIGWGLALATEAQPTAQAGSDAIGTVDPVPSRYQLGQELYLENCASCHIALPPSVLPTQTWQQVLQDSQHYGVKLPPLVDPPRLLVWNYLQYFSRSQSKAEETPYTIDDSRYFKALHPRVKLPRPVQISSCAVCHPSAAQYNFRRLTPEWQNSQ
jgi:mono/diheme cytochrome c family protein